MGVADIYNEFTSWTRYPNNQNITFDHPSPLSVSGATYPEQIEMFPSPDRVSYDSGQMISFRCTGRIGNQFNVNNLQNLWTWEWRSIDNVFTSWTRYPNEQNITYEPPTPMSGSGGCQYNGASTLIHTVSNLDNGRQFRCSVISEDYSDNKTVLVVGQQPQGPTSRPVTSKTGGQESAIGVGVAIGVCVMLVVDAICLGLAFLYRDEIANCISGVKKTSNTEMPVMSNIQTPATVISPVEIQTQGDEYETPVNRNHYDALQTETADIPNTYEKIRTYQNM
ncbi:uncharacterized protein [Haliotis cracherodii]|uniref:uncharacterized protein n=1 Tax=Haliotis cracherodii TaxID=6455 RepID=UPI0039EC6B10